MLLRRHRGYFFFATLTLAVAVGVNLIVFSVVNALWLRPLPFPEADRLVTLPAARVRALDAVGLEIFGGAVAGQVITDDFPFARPQIEITFNQIGRELETLAVTSGYFRLLGLAVHGRDFTTEDDRVGAAPVGIISHRLWSSGFERRPDLIGSVIPARPFPIRVVGIAPPGFEGARRGERADLWIPSRLAPQILNTSVAMMVFARLPPGQTATEIDRHLREKYANDRVRPLLTVVPLRDVFGTPESRTIVIREGNAFAVVVALASLVLFGAGATLGALVLVHSERRGAEIAVRIALGASRMRLIAERSVELGMIATCGTIGAVVVATLALGSLPSFSLPGGVDLGRLDLSIDWRVLAVATATSVLVLLVAAWVPLARSTRGNRVGELFAGPAATASTASQRLRQMLLALQVCATIIVLVAAGLFVRAIIHGFGTAPRFDVDRTVFVSIQEESPMAGPGQGWAQVVRERATRVREALGSVPGVQMAAEGRPPIGADAMNLLTRPILVEARGERREMLLGRMDGSFELLSTLGVPILAGRALTAADVTMQPVPAVVTESLAQSLWPTESPLGQTLWTNLRDGRFVIVGIARDFVFGSLTRPASGVVVTARSGLESRFIVRSEHPDAVVKAIREVAKTTVPGATSVKIATGREVIAQDLGRQRLGAWLFSGFGIATLILGFGGVFGLVAYLAESRRREFGVRLAMGATANDLMRQGLVAALLPVAIGMAAGLPLAALMSRVFKSQLPAVSSVDPLTYVAVAGALVACSCAAALVAGWRLRRIAPMDALRIN